MEYQQRDIDQHRRGHGLKNADDKRLLAGLLELRQAELVAYREGDEAERDVGYKPDALQLLVAFKADAGDAQRTDEAGADQNARNEVSRHVGQMCFFEKSGHHKPGKHCDGKG